jgi:acyl-CoA dehydrogenase
MIKTAPDQYQAIRDAVRALCAQYPDAYHRPIDQQRGYPEAFVDALWQIAGAQRGVRPTRSGASYPNPGAARAGPGAQRVRGA